MARNLGETTVTIPVLDRLIDLEPGNQTENPKNVGISAGPVRSPWML